MVFSVYEKTDLLNLPDNPENEEFRPGFDYNFVASVPLTEVLTPSDSKIILSLRNNSFNFNSISSVPNDVCFVTFDQTELSKLFVQYEKFCSIDLFGKYYFSIPCRIGNDLLLFLPEASNYCMLNAAIKKLYSILKTLISEFLRCKIIYRTVVSVISEESKGEMKNE